MTIMMIKRDCVIWLHKCDFAGIVFSVTCVYSFLFLALVLTPDLIRYRYENEIHSNIDSKEITKRRFTQHHS